MNQIDIQQIRDNVSKKHNEFMADLGTHSDRVLAEHNLVMELTFTRIKFICDNFIELQIIDKVEFKNITGVRKAYIAQDGYDNCVCISTNGDRIIVDGASYVTNMLAEPLIDREIFDGASLEDFDWVDFSDKLLQSIHSIIYERKEAFESKLWGSGCSIPKDDSIQTKMIKTG
jgi:hypothetical protein